MSDVPPIGKSGLSERDRGNGGGGGAEEVPARRGARGLVLVLRVLRCTRIVSLHVRSSVIMAEDAMDRVARQRRRVSAAAA